MMSDTMFFEPQNPGEFNKMPISLLNRPKTIVHDVAILNRVLWMNHTQQAALKRLEINPKRYAMNPNRFLADLLSNFEGRFYKAQLKLELRQSTSGVLFVSKECAESVLKLLFGRIVSMAQPGSTLHLIWTRQEEGLSLQITLNPPATQGFDRVPLPLLPQTSPLRKQLESAGIRYQSDNSNGPWSLTFNTIDI